VADHADYAAWLKHHGNYLANAVFRNHLDDGLPGILDPDDPDQCPETFRQIDPASPLCQSDPQVLLVRVEQIDSIADRSDEPRDGLKTLMREVAAAGDAKVPAHGALNDILAEWSRHLEVRPTFADYWDEVAGLFGPTPDQDQPDWADTLRDRLGLYHLNPAHRALRPIDVVVFRYPVSAVPKLNKLKRQRDLRPLVPPTVLDGKHSDAFCPAPYNETSGYVVDLGQEVPPLRREVVHPPVAFTAENVWRVGEIRRMVTQAQLTEARACHLLCVVEQAGDAGYAKDTDSDLLSGP
jgi:nitroreductase